MKKEKLFEREYRNRMTHAAPDLWDRIESGLEEYPERSMAEAPRGGSVGSRKESGKILSLPRRRLYGAAAAAAAMLVLLAVSPKFLELHMDQRSGAALTATTAAARDMGGQRTGAQAAAGGASLEMGALAGGLMEEDEEATVEETAVEEATVEETEMDLEKQMDGGAAASEDRLKNTRMLCQVTVRRAQSLEAGDGRSAGYRYEAEVDAVYYEAGNRDSENAGEEGSAAENREEIAVGDVIEVVIPDAGAGNPGEGPLQMLVDASYLLPLIPRGSVWEPVLSDVPQIRRNEDGSYLFPAVYHSLADKSEEWYGQQEADSSGASARMLLRTDGAFVSELVGLIREKAEK